MWKELPNTWGGKRYLWEAKGFIVSYNPKTDCGPETALYAKGNYYILKGDHRKQYEPLIPEGYKACKAYYDANKDKASIWTDGDDSNILYKVDAVLDLLKRKALQ